jgi:hypothetical protein
MADADPAVEAVARFVCRSECPYVAARDRRCAAACIAHADSPRLAGYRDVIRKAMPLMRDYLEHRDRFIDFDAARRGWW